MLLWTVQPLSALREIALRHEGQTVAVCGHGYMINSILCGLFDGFTDPARPTVLKLTDGEWAAYDTTENGAFDGYMIHFCEDGTYGFSFVFTQEDPSDETAFRVEAPGIADQQAEPAAR